MAHPMMVGVQCASNGFVWPSEFPQAQLQQQNLQSNHPGSRKKGSGQAASATDATRSGDRHRSTVALRGTQFAVGLCTGGLMGGGACRSLFWSTTKVDVDITFTHAHARPRCTPQQPQVILLREGTDTSQGKPQLISNINACVAVVDCVRTTLGPRGMDKLIYDQRVRIACA